MSASFKAACVQVNASDDMAGNIKTAVGFIHEARAAGADFVSCPENVSFIGATTTESRDRALPESEHPALAAFSGAARETGIWLLGGSLGIRHDDGRVTNRSFLIGPEGEISARYDKIHMFNVDLKGGESYCESEIFQPGGCAVTAPLPWGKLGMTICYDMRFPYLYRALAHAGADIVTAPSAFTKPTGEAHWHVLLRARAIETGSFVIAPAQCGEHAGGRKTFGHSLIINPWGEILADSGVSPGVSLAEIDMERVAEARRMIPSLQHDRPFSGPDRESSSSAA